MNIKTIFKSALKQRNYTQGKLAERLGITNQNSISQYFKSGNKVSLSKVMELFNELDYDIVIRSRLTDKTEWVVDEGTIVDHPEVDVSSGIIKKAKTGELIKSDEIELLIKEVIDGKFEQIMKELKK